MTKGINKEKRICSWVLFLRRLRLCWCEGARTRRRVVETNQPSKRPPTDQPGGGAEALGMLVGQSSPNRRAVEMRALVFWKFRRYQISCIIFTLSSQYPLSIGVRWYERDLGGIGGVCDSLPLSRAPIGSGAHVSYPPRSLDSPPLSSYRTIAQLWSS